MVRIRRFWPKTKTLKGKRFIVIASPPNVLNAKYFALGSYVLMWKRRRSIWDYTPTRKALALSIPFLGHPSFRLEWEDVLYNYYELLEDHKQEKRFSQVPRIFNASIHGMSVFTHLGYLWFLWAYEKVLYTKYL